MESLTQSFECLSSLEQMSKDFPSQTLQEAFETIFFHPSVQQWNPEA